MSNEPIRMNCDRAKELIPLLALGGGELNATWLADLQGHLQTCANCAELHEKRLQVAIARGELPTAEVPSWLREEIRQQRRQWEKPSESPIRVGEDEYDGAPRSDFSVEAADAPHVPDGMLQFAVPAWRDASRTENDRDAERKAVKVDFKNEMVKITDYVASTLSSTRDAAYILERLASKISEVTKSDIVVLYPYSGTFKEGRFEDPICYGQVSSTSYRLPRPRGLARRVMEHNEKLMEVTLGDVVTIDGREHPNDPDIPNTFTIQENVKSFLAARLQLGAEGRDNIKGVCYVNRKSDEPFKAEEKELLGFIADLAAIVIEFAREAVRSRLSDSAGVISHDTSIKPDQESLLGSIVEQACKLMNAQAGCIWLYEDESRKILVRAAAYGNARGLAYRVPVDMSATGNILQSDMECHYIRDVQKEDKYFAKREAYEANLHSMLVAKLRVGEELRGAFNIYSVDEPRVFGKWHEALLSAFASLSSIAIHVHETLMSQVSDRERIIEVAQELSAIRDLDDIVQFVVDQAQQLTDADCACLYPYNPPTESFLRGRVSAKDIVLRNAFERRVPREEGLSKWIVKNRLKKEIPDATKDKDVRTQTRELGIRSLAGLPLCRGERSVGVLWVDFKRDVNFTSPEMSAKIKSVELLSNLAAGAIENAILYNQIQRRHTECKVLLALHPDGVEGKKNRWGGFIQAEGALLDADFFSVPWERDDWEKLAGKADEIGDLAYSEKADWQNQAKELGTRVSRTFMSDSGPNVAFIMRSALGLRETKLSFRITSDLMRFPYEFAYENDFWAVYHPMSRYLVDAQQTHFVSFDSFLTQLVFGHLPGEKLKVLLISTDLPEVQRECKSVSRVLKKTLEGLVEIEHVRGAEATVDRIREEMTRDRGYDILHFAGHSFFDNNHPERSCLRLHKGNLFVPTLRQLLREARIKFVYLSSCRGGAFGMQDHRFGNLLSLADAVVHAGVSAVLAFRWRVKDEHAALMATRFYQSLFSIWSPAYRPLELAVALRDARLQVRDEIRREADIGGRGDVKKTADDGCWLSPILITQY